MSMTDPSIVALIPARSGSERIADKNVRDFCGHPLLAWSINVAQESGIFNEIYVSTDSVEYLQIAADYGAQLIRRTLEISTSTSPDIEWVESALASLPRMPKAFCILRPTSPFRTPSMLLCAWADFLMHSQIDSLRAVQPVSEHPSKMWIANQVQKVMSPMLEDRPWDFGNFQIPMHSQQVATLPPIFVQNASLEIVWSRVVTEKKSISGDRIMPFFPDGETGYDINTQRDWDIAEWLVESGRVVMPEMKVSVPA